MQSQVFYSKREAGEGPTGRYWRACVEARCGSVTFMVVVLLTLLTLLGICASDNAHVEQRIARNESGYQRDFYVAEGGIARESREIGSGRYRIRDFGRREVLASHMDEILPKPVPHTVMGIPYGFTVEYTGAVIPSKGFSAIAFREYHYEIRTRKNETRIRAVYGRIGKNPYQ